VREHRLTQAHEAALAQARTNAIQEESKQKLAHGKEIHDEKQQALSKNKVSLVKAKVGRDALEEYLNENSYWVAKTESLRRELIRSDRGL
jgi:hypothetical protein